MIWTVIAVDALLDFLDRHSDVGDALLRTAVAAWVSLLLEPPPENEATFNAALAVWEYDIPGVPVTAEYLVLDWLDEPAIVIRRLRDW